MRRSRWLGGRLGGAAAATLMLAGAITGDRPGQGWRVRLRRLDWRGAAQSRRRRQHSEQCHGPVRLRRLGGGRLHHRGKVPISRCPLLLTGAGAWCGKRSPEAAKRSN
jgi:hypothetical protein